jgi:hypothetical protein
LHGTACPYVAEPLHYSEICPDVWASSGTPLPGVVQRYLHAPPSAAVPPRSRHAIDPCTIRLRSIWEMVCVPMSGLDRNPKRKRGKMFRPSLTLRVTIRSTTLRSGPPCRLSLSISRLRTGQITAKLPRLQQPGCQQRCCRQRAAGAASLTDSAVPLGASRPNRRRPPRP